MNRPAPPPVLPSDRHAFDTVIDARSPAEFAIDRLPGAINCPVLDDAERAVVGTLYKQQGAFEARRVGGAMVAANLALHLRTQFADRPPRWRPLVYCWRGGMRSGSMVTWLRLVGWNAQQLAGGYKAWRRHAITLIDALAPQLDLRVVCGATGSAKTRVLAALADQGHQTLDLEDFAAHKGSMLGALPGVAQPSQTAFETRLAAALETIDLQRPLYVEGESARIGRLSVPPALVRHMRAAAVIEIDAPPSARHAFLLRDYAYLGDDPAWLAERLVALKPLHGAATVARWQSWAQARDLAPLFAELATQHYDPAYLRSQAAHFFAWPQRRTVAASDLSPDRLAPLAQEIAALG